MPSHPQTVPAENPQKVPQLVQQQILNRNVALATNAEQNACWQYTPQIDNAMLSKSPQEKETERQTDRQSGEGRGHVCSHSEDL